MVWCQPKISASNAISALLNMVFWCFTKFYINIPYIAISCWLKILSNICLKNHHIADSQNKCSHVHSLFPTHIQLIIHFAFYHKVKMLYRLLLMMHYNSTKFFVWICVWDGVKWLSLILNNCWHWFILLESHLTAVLIN